MLKHGLACLFLQLVFCSLPQGLSAQLNIKVGYGLGYSPAKISNQITTDHDARMPWLEESLGEMHLLNDMQFGLRYRVGQVGIEASFVNKFKTYRSNGIDPATEQSFFRDLFFRYSSISLGFENYLGKFGYGASLDANWARFRMEVTGREDRFIVTNPFAWGSHFHLSYNIDSGDLLTISIKPYLQIPWTKFDLYELEQELNPVAAEPGGFKEDFLNFGIMLVFYNGQF